MPKQLVPNVASFELLYRFVQQAPGTASFPVMQNTLYLRDTVGAWTAAALAARAALLQTWWQNNLRQLQGGLTELIRIDAEDLGADPGVKLTFDVTPPQAGTAPGPALTTMAALHMEIRGDAGGEPRRGRLFWPIGTEDSIQGNLWTPTFLADADAAIQELEGGFAGGPPALVLVSRIANGVRRPVGISNTWASYQMKPLVGAMARRRK